MEKKPNIKTHTLQSSNKEHRTKKVIYAMHIHEYMGNKCFSSP